MSNFIGDPVLGALLSVECVALVSSSLPYPVRYPSETTAMPTNCSVARAIHKGRETRKGFTLGTFFIEVELDPLRPWALAAP